MAILLDERFKLRKTEFTAIPEGPGRGVWCEDCELVFEVGDPVLIHKPTARLFCAFCGGDRVRGVPSILKWRPPVLKGLETVWRPDKGLHCALCKTSLDKGDDVFRQVHVEVNTGVAWREIVCYDCGRPDRAASPPGS